MNNSKLDDLGLTKSCGADKWEKVIGEKFGLKPIDFQQAICVWLKENAHTLIEDIKNIAPHGKYSLLIEEEGEILSFLKEEASKFENWLIHGAQYDHDSDLIEFTFFCKAVDDGDVLRGNVLLGKSGKIRHAFVNYYN